MNDPKRGFELRVPEYLDGDAYEIEMKGYLDATLVVGDRSIHLTFYDPIRLSQDVEAVLERGSSAFAGTVIVVPSVTRSSIAKAIEELAGRDFEDLLPR